jgi:hypothetical protein
MSTGRRIIHTLVVLALWVCVLGPFSVAGVLSTTAFGVVVVLTVAGMVAVWVPRHRLKQLLRTS